MKTLSIAEAKSRFSELVSRAGSGERLVIERRKRPVAVVVAPEDLARLERAAELGFDLARALGQSEEILRQIERGELHPAMAAFGLWRDDDELDQIMDEVIAARHRPSRRRVKVA